MLQGAGQTMNAGDAAARGDYLGMMDGLQGARGSLNNAFRPCFTGKMLIATKAGYKRFSELKKDEAVLASPEDGESKEVSTQLVEEVFERLGRIWLLKIGEEVIETTDEHPFWVESKGWVPTHELMPGDLLRTLDKRLVAVSSVEETERVETVYNCRVANWHTYFVRSEEATEGVWSHNSRCAIPSPNGSNGKPDHQRAVIALRKMLAQKYPKEKGYVITSNKGSLSSLGSSRRPDAVVIRNKKPLVVGEVSRTNKDGSLVPRENKKINEYARMRIKKIVIVGLPKR